MSEALIRKSLELTPAQWARLDQIAADMQSLAKGGPGHNKPSWRILLRQIADNTLIVTRREDGTR